MSRFALALTLAGSLLAGLAAPATAAPDRERWDTQVFSLVPEPGHPAYVFVHPNRRVYAGTYSSPQGDSQRSRVFEWSRSGTLLRSWTVPGQDLAASHGVQVANADARGRLVLLEKSRAAVMTLDVETGKFRRWATIPTCPTSTANRSPTTRPGAPAARSTSPTTARP